MAKATVAQTKIPQVLNLISTPRYKLKVSGQTRTDSHLINEQLDFIPEEHWKQGVLVLDGACGRGSYLLAAGERLLKYHSKENVLSMLYGVDIDSYCVYNTKVILSKLLEVDEADLDSTIVQDNFLEMKLDMKFDVVVGNPPFQEAKEDGSRKDQASNLWTKFWMKGLESAKDDGIVSLITPTTWVSPSYDVPGIRLWDEFKKYTSYANITDVEKYFNVGSSFGYVVVDKSGTDGLKFSNGESIELDFLPKGNLAEVKQKLSTDEKLTVAQYKTSQSNDPEKRVAVPLSKVVTEESVQVLDGAGAPVNGSKENLYLYIYAGKNCDNVRQKILDAKDIINKHCRWSGFANIKIIKMVKV